MNQEGPVVVGGAAEEDSASCWTSALASDVYDDWGLMARSLLAAVGDFVDLVWNCREKLGRGATLNLADGEAYGRCVGVLVAQRLVDATPFALTVLLFGHLSRDSWLLRVGVQTRVKLWTVQSFIESQVLVVNATSSSDLLVLLSGALKS